VLIKLLSKLYKRYWESLFKPGDLSFLSFGEMLTVAMKQSVHES